MVRLAGGVDGDESVGAMRRPCIVCSASPFFNVFDVALEGLTRLTTSTTGLGSEALAAIWVLLLVVRFSDITNDVILVRPFTASADAYGANGSFPF